MYNYAAITDIGPRFAVNDDRILVGNAIVSDGEIEGTIHDKFVLVAIADGVGGLQMGYEAAELTLCHLSNLNQPEMGRMNIRNTVESTNQKVISLQAELNINDGLRTTLAALYIDGQVAYVINAGDSRVYRFRNNFLEQLSKDHSVVQNLIDTGEITEEESYSHPKRNVITKCIGEEDKVNARIIDYSQDVFPDDLFLLCSDGISDCLRIEEMNEILLNRREMSLIEICRELINKALDNGSIDNISICLMKKEN